MEDQSPVNELAQASTAVIDHDRSVDAALVAAARQAAAAGVVLLKNTGDVLPLRKQEAVAVFGRVQRDWIAVGYGSGGDVNAPYTTNLLDSLVEGGHVDVLEEVAETYRQWCAANPPEEGTWGNWPRHYPEMPVDSALVERAARQAQTALVVIGRAAGEDRENVLEPGSYYLTDAERELLAAVTEAFTRTVVIVDTGNVMDLSWVEEYQVDGLVLAWLGGMEGARALADVLCGVVEPGGRLTDTIAYRYEDYPSAGHFGGLDYNEYVEDVFVGYRYFETFAPERVQFPFGFGLGYTRFVLETMRCATDAASGDLEVTVRVTNTGERTGSEVVQVYLGDPGGLLSQPARRLVGYARTAPLDSGSSTEVTVRAPRSHLASYDDAGVTGARSAWVLEAGDYPVYVGTDVRQASAAGTHTIGELAVVAQIEEAAAPVEVFDRMVARRGADGSYVLGWEPVPTATVDLARRILERLPEPLPVTGNQGIELSDVAAGSANLDDFLAQFDVEDLATLAYGDIIMDSPLGVPGNAGTFGGVTESLRAYGVPPVTTTDGPSGVRVSAYASLLPCGTALASAWDPALVEELATLHGVEVLAKGSDILLSPGMNIHRDPLCGRNFEYFSEDPLITGLTGAAVVRGLQREGASACPKHYAANNQETNRNRNDSRVSERALREIYLRGFQLCVEQAAPKTIMTAYNKVNGVWAHYHYDLVTTILRGEWGYQGAVITDWWMQAAQDPNFPALRDSAYRVRAGVDVLMPGGSPARADERGNDLEYTYALQDGLTLGEIQRTARNVLRFILESGRLDRGPITSEPRAEIEENGTLTASSTVGQWLRSEHGRPLFLALADSIGTTEDQLGPARTFPLQALVEMGGGALTQDAVDRLVERAAASQEADR